MLKVCSLIPYTSPAFRFAPLMEIPQSVPLSLRAMFDQYFQLGQRIRKHYLSPGVLLCLATGQFLPPVHRKSLYSLQYSMLPARRASIWEVWSRLTEEPLPMNGDGSADSPTRRRSGEVK